MPPPLPGRAGGLDRRGREIVLPKVITANPLAPVPVPAARRWPRCPPTGTAPHRADDIARHTARAGTVVTK